MTASAATQLEQVRRQMLADTERWLPELDSNVRSTLWHGVFAKAVKETERVYQLCVDVALPLAGALGPEKVSAVGNGKPLERLTMGERMDVLKTLDRQRVIVDGIKIISKPDRLLLEDLTTLRNKFVHGEIPVNEGPAYAKRFLMLARQLSESQVVQALANSHG